MSIFIEKQGVKYKVIYALDNNQYLVTRADNNNRGILIEIGQIIEYKPSLIDRIKEFIKECLSL